MTAVSIRFATADDVPAVAAIYDDSVANGTGSFELEPPGHAEMARRFAELTAAGYPWLIAEDRGRVIGFAYAGPYRERAGYNHCVQDAIYLAPDARGRGIGKLLLAGLIVEAERCGFRQLIGIVGDSANRASIRLHAALGFETIGTLADIGWKHGRWLDTVMMQLTLGEGATTPPKRR